MVILQIGDILAAIMLFVLIIIATCFLSIEAGIEADSLLKRVSINENNIRKLKPIPRIEIKRGTVYAGAGEIVVEIIKKEQDER